MNSRTACLARVAPLLLFCYQAAGFTQEVASPDAPSAPQQTTSDQAAERPEHSAWTTTIRSTATFGIGVRTKGQRSTLKPGGSSNSDDSDLNYRSGDTFSRVGKLTSKLDVKNEAGYGFALGATAWYDDGQLSDGVPHGNNPNNYAPGMPLSDSGFASQARFRGIELLDAHFYGKSELFNGPVTWRVGRLSLEREQGFSFNGGLRDLETRNTAASTRPGALPEEGVLPVWGATARWSVTPNLRVDGFLQFAPQESVTSGCGTFMSTNDYAAEGCDRVFYSDRLIEQQNVARGIFTPRSPDRKPKNRPDQFGLGASYLLRDLGTRVGLFYAHYDSRVGYTGVEKGRALGPSGGSTYVIEYPEDKNLLALTSATRIPDAGFSWLNEISITNGQPVNLNTTDLQQAFLTGGGILGQDARRTQANSLYHGYDRFRVVQAQTGFMKEFKGVLGSQKSFFGAEAGLKHVVGLPDVNIRRYGRPESTSVCATAAACATNDGYVTSTAWAYRIRAGMEYFIPSSSIRLRPSVGFSHDVKGWSYDYAFIQGRKTLRLALDVDFGRDVFANLTYAISRGGQFNTRKDMDFLMASVGIRF